MSPSEDAVKKTPEPLICSYPGSAVETPNDVFDDRKFQSELANFLFRPNAVDSDLPLPLPTDPQYINALVNDVLQSIGRTADVPPVTKRTAALTNIWRGGHTADGSRIIKRVRDHVGWSSALDVKHVWRRSPLWLLIRVAIQMTVNRSLERASYKRFVLFFTCTLAGAKGNKRLSSDLLHLMSSQIFRRLSKLGSSAPEWLSETALKTCSCLQEILDARWEQLNARPSPFRNPSQDELTRDTKLSLLASHEYIRNTLANPVPQLRRTSFHPNHRRRGTLEDFLSSNGTFFDEAYAADPDVTIYDVERSVEEGIDDWFACVTDVDEACAQLGTLTDKYLEKASWGKSENLEYVSVALLTGIELCVVLDKLAVKEIPMLADYSPEIPIALLERLLLRKTTSLHRLSCAYQYLSARHSRSRPGWSLLSDEFTEDSFPVRYYDQSPHLQQLKARIEQNAMEEVAGRAGPQLECASLAQAYDGHQQLLPGHRLAEWARSPLPALPLHAKVVVFELQCPACIRIWRSAAPRFLHSGVRPIEKQKYNLLAHVPAFQPYFVERQGPPLSVQIHLAYVDAEGFQSRNSPTLRHIVQYGNCLSIWKPIDSEVFADPFPKYVKQTVHTPNEVLAAQMDCPADLSLNEFVAFAHLRSGGSLQWLNILQGLRSRTLNLRRYHVHYLLAHAAFQVGPLDLNTGTWIWHQELQDSCFCNALLNELDSLFMDVAGLIDGVLMNTISLLLTRVLASSPSRGVSDRAIGLLRSVRKVTFSWVQELSYDLAKAPTNEERRKLLLDMAATCRSTFDVDPAIFRKVFHSAEDVDALLSCGFFIHTLHTRGMSNF